MEVLAYSAYNVLGRDGSGAGGAYEQANEYGLLNLPHLTRD